MRATMMLAWLAAVVLLVWPWLKPRAVPPRPRAAADELVKDPVCHTYVVRSRAVRVTEAGVPRYFCSPRCAEKFALGRG
jgi:YHS domain-containing protein